MSPTTAKGTTNLIVTTGPTPSTTKELPTTAATITQTKNLPNNATATMTKAYTTATTKAAQVN
jgi:hypothetical protein